MNRRGFMQSILAAGAAPYISTASGILMPLGKVFTLDHLVSSGDMFEGNLWNGAEWVESSGDLYWPTRTPSIILKPHGLGVRYDLEMAWKKIRG